MADLIQTFQPRKVRTCPMWQGQFAKQRFEVTAAHCKNCPSYIKGSKWSRQDCKLLKTHSVLYRTFREHPVVRCPQGKTGRVYASQQNCAFCSHGRVVGNKSSCRYGRW